MKNRVSDFELDEKLKSYMGNGAERAFPLDEMRVFKNTDTQSGARVFRKATVVAAIVLILLASTLTIPSVRAAVGRLFTFIPGVGISEQSDNSIYTMNHIVRQIDVDSGTSSNQVQAQLDNAVYSNGYLCVSTIINGKYIDFDNDLTFYIDGEQVEYSSSGTRSSGPEGIEVNHYMWLKMNEPNSDKLYEVEIAGFPGRLSFTLEKCLEYSDLAQIGPTDTQNGISITTTAIRSENQLTVWCYPFNTTGDKIAGIGAANPSIWNNETYIETESGFIGVYNKSGQQIMERFVCDIPEGDSFATLHIPYLTLVRDEKKTVSIPVPTDYSSMECNISVEFSLGIVRITEIERKPSEFDGQPDVLRISFTLDSSDSSMVFNSFELRNTSGDPVGWMMQFNDETGCLQFIETDIEDNASKFSFEITDLCYYLLGEYVIPLEIK